MRVIALFGRGDIGKTHCLGHLINLIHYEEHGFNYLFEGQDARVTLEYKGYRITICTWGDNEHEERLNIDKIRNDHTDIAIVATRTKGRTVEVVDEFCKGMGYDPPKWVEKYVACFDDKSGQEYLNNLQAKQILDYIQGLIKGQLYYVDSITEIINNDDNQGHRYHVTLFGTEIPDDGYPRTVSLELNDDELFIQKAKRRIQEDDFVLFRPDSEKRFFYGDETPMAVALRNECRVLRRELSFRTPQGDATLAFISREPVVAKSYHVNVGHGNCSLVLSVFGQKYELWMVDCSTYDYQIRRDYSQDLYCCLSDIAVQLGISLKDLRVSRFMLTHTHFDHYNGLKYLMKHGYIDSHTVIYANLHYDCASPVWNDILKGLMKLGCGFVEPTSAVVSNGAVQVYHPECRVYKNSALIKSGERAVPNVNDSSVVYGIAMAGHLMIFPGDLEQKGFEIMSGAGTCSSYLFKADYYVVSHHGSVNGHPTMECMSHKLAGATPLTCVANNLKKVILMGRDRAYSGIYSPEVISAWSRFGCLEYSERAPHYLELDWKSGKVSLK